MAIDFRSTRGKLLQTLKKAGSCTLQELAREFHFSLPTIRHHLHILEKDSLVESEAIKGGLGRPRMVYKLTPHGDGVFPRRDKELLRRAFEAIVRNGGAVNVEELCESILKDILEENRHIAAIPDLEKRVEAVLDILIDLGSLRELKHTPEGFVLQIYDCPLSKLPSNYPQICKIPHVTLAELVGADVELTEWMVKGDHRCSFKITPLPERRPHRAPNTRQSAAKKGTVAGSGSAKTYRTEKLYREKEGRPKTKYSGETSGDS